MIVWRTKRANRNGHNSLFLIRGSRAVGTLSAPLVGMNRRQNTTTFHAYNFALQLIEELQPLVVTIERRDRDLARQLRKAASSVALNLSEGRKREGKDRLHLWRIADGSAEESRACLDVAIRWGYLHEDTLTEVMETLDRLLAICWRLTHPR